MNYFPVCKEQNMKYEYNEYIKLDLYDINIFKNTFDRQITEHSTYTRIQSWLNPA